MGDFVDLARKRPLACAFLVLLLVAPSLMYLQQTVSRREAPADASQPEAERVEQLGAELRVAQTNLQVTQAEVQRLETQLARFRTAALKHFPGTEEESLNKLAARLNELATLDFDKTPGASPSEQTSTGVAGAQADPAAFVDWAAIDWTNVVEELKWVPKLFPVLITWPGGDQETAKHGQSLADSLMEGGFELAEGSGADASSAAPPQGISIHKPTATVLRASAEVLRGALERVGLKVRLLESAESSDAAIRLTVGPNPAK